MRIDIHIDTERFDVFHLSNFAIAYAETGLALS